MAPGDQTRWHVSLLVLSGFDQYIRRTQDAAVYQRARPDFGRSRHFGKMDAEACSSQERDQFEDCEVISQHFGMPVDSGFGVGNFVSALELVDEFLRRLHPGRVVVAAGVPRKRLRSV